MRFTSVISYHRDPLSCGVANFSQQLAQRLGVEWVGFDQPHRWGNFPLVSLKASEMDYGRVVMPPRYAVFWHDEGTTAITRYAEMVFHADPSLGPNGVFCPSLIRPAPHRPLFLFSFGMAHKLQIAHYDKVRLLLQKAGLDYHLSVSCGLHEGTSLSDATQHFDALKTLMGPDKVTILGILSDEAVAIELRDCDYVLAFFEKGVRANNTTVHAALQARKTVITNHDEKTPAFLKATTRDIVTRTEWEASIPYYYSWDNLIEKMEEIYAATADRQPTHQR